MPNAEEFLRRIAEQKALEEMGPGAPPMAPMGAEPPEFYSDVANAGLGNAPMAPGATTVGGSPQMLANPAIQIALALQKARQMAHQGR